MPNIEIELKYKIKNQAAVDTKLKNIGAKFIKEFYCIDTYFMVPENKDGKKYLRVREVKGEMKIAFFHTISPTHSEEWETPIDNAVIVKEILQKIGHELDVVVEKSRKVYRYENSEIVVDTVKDLGNYIEIESPSLEELEKIEKIFEFTKSMRIDDRGYPDMIRENLINQ